jgi:hypothetical protein
LFKTSQEEEIQITAEDKESWFQNSIPLLEKYEVPLGSYPYYRQLANISNSERSYLIQVNSWGKQIFQVKHGLDNAQDFEKMLLLRKSPGFFHFPEDRIKDYIRFAQQQPDLYENYNWTFYNAIIDNPSFFQNDNNRKLLNKFLYSGSSHPEAWILDAIDFIQKISRYPEIYNYLLIESAEKYEVVKTYLEFCETYNDQVDFLYQGLKRFGFIHKFYMFINQFQENGSINFKEAREAFQFVDDSTSLLAAENFKKAKDELKTPEELEAFSQVTRTYFKSPLVTPHLPDHTDNNRKIDIQQYFEPEALIFLAKTKIGQATKLFTSNPIVLTGAIKQIIRHYYFLKNNGNLNDEKILEVCDNLFTGDNAVGIVNAPPHLSSEIYKDIVLQKSGLSQLKYYDNLDFIHNYYNIFTYLNQNIIHKIIKEISQNLFINLNSENVNLLDAPLKNVEGFVKSFVDFNQNSKKYIPNNFLQGFLNYFFSKNTYDNSKYLYNLKDNLSEIPEEEFSPQFYDSLVLQFIENNYYHKRFKDFDGDLLEYVSLYETEGTNLNQYKLSDDQIKELKRIYDENAKELTLPKALLINISVILLTRGVDLSGDFAKKINNSSLLDKITKSMLESSNEDSKDIEIVLKEYSNLVTPYFLTSIANSLASKDQEYLEKLKSLPLDVKLILILDSDDVSEAEEFANKFDRQYRNLHKNSKEYFVVLCFVITYKNLFGVSSNLIISGVNNNITKDGNFDSIDQDTQAFAFLLLVFGRNIDNWLRKFNSPHDAVNGFNQDFKWPKYDKSFGDYLLKATMGYKNLSSFPVKDIGIIQKFWSELTEDEKKLSFSQLASACTVKNFKQVHSQYDVKSEEFVSEYVGSGIKVDYEILQDHYLKSLSVPLPSWTNVVIHKGSLTGRFLPRKDARGMFLGKYTDCCQTPGDAGAGPALYGQIEPNSGFFVVENTKGQIVAQSWVWEDENKNIVFDNIEGKGFGYNPDDSDEVKAQKLQRQKQIFQLYTAFSSMMPEYSVFVGGGYSKVDLQALSQEDKIEQEYDYKGKIPRKSYRIRTEEDDDGNVLDERIVIDNDEQIYSDAYVQYRILRSNNDSA